MHIERPHAVGQPEAIRRINTFIDGLMTHPLPHGVTVSDISKDWSDNILHFSFKARKFFFSAHLAGTVQVNDDSIVMDFDLPPLLAKFISEAEIHDRISTELSQLFSTKPS